MYNVDVITLKTYLRTILEQSEFFFVDNNKREAVQPAGQMSKYILILFWGYYYYVRPPHVIIVKIHFHHHTIVRRNNSTRCIVTSIPGDVSRTFRHISLGSVDSIIRLSNPVGAIAILPRRKT